MKTETQWSVTKDHILTVRFVNVQRERLLLIVHNLKLMFPHARWNSNQNYWELNPRDMEYLVEFVSSQVGIGTLRYTIRLVRPEQPRLL